MYFHGSSNLSKGQWTALATSPDGLNFKLSSGLLGKFYFRVFKHEAFYYAIAKDGNNGWGELYCSKDGKSNFKSRGHFLQNVRHTAVLIRDQYLLIFFSRKGDAPERILCSTIDLNQHWLDWEPSEPIEIISPQLPYEGVDFENKPSEYGPAIKVRQLRDPYIFSEQSKTFLFYSIAGEMGIAMAELDINIKA